MADTSKVTSNLSNTTGGSRDTPSPPPFLTNEEVKRHLHWNTLVPATETLFANVSRHNELVIQPPRLIMPISQQNAALLCMPAYLAEDNVLACKVVTSFRNNAALGLPSILATVILFDGSNGGTKMIMEGTEITTWRTAAASVAATKNLFRRIKDKDLVLAIMGSGVQAHIHAQAFMSYFSIKEIRIWNHRFAGAEALCKRLGDIAKPFPDKEECVKPADLIVTATYSPTPVVHYDWLKSDAHINAVGFGVSHHSELDENTYRKASVFVDSLDGAKQELKSLHEAGIKFTEVGAVINGTERVPPNGGVTVFQSLGMGGEDAITAKLIFNDYMKHKNQGK
ncbi:unnamed protein product [Bemisia tabaci]|uniref:Ketimine reductase mu-crystallin n=1 Tax=Bemisia tabaci TaxID=7038 RepID=A0A9P0A796_BEMTA|nr:unnamed protein product [Bemisia tabaci]